jgi:hypothetical protein
VNVTRSFQLETRRDAVCRVSTQPGEDTFKARGNPRTASR